MKGSSGENSRRSIPYREKNLYTIVVILVVVLVIALCLNTVAAQRVNCRKFVFAPICRGTASKRAQILAPGDGDDIYRVQEGKSEIENEYPMGITQDNENKLGSFREMMHRQRRLYRHMEQQQKSEPFDPSIYDY